MLRGVGEYGFSENKRGWRWYTAYIHSEYIEERIVGGIYWFNQLILTFSGIFFFKILFFNIKKLYFINHTVQHNIYWRIFGIVYILICGNTPLVLKTHDPVSRLRDSYHKQTKSSLLQWCDCVCLLQFKL